MILLLLSYNFVWGCSQFDWPLFLNSIGLL